MILSRHPAHHGYLIDGQPVPSVTGILKESGLSPDFSTIDPTVLERARQRGIAVHVIADTIDKGGDIGLLTDELAPYAHAYLRFRYDAGFEVIASEHPLYHPTLLYAGTVDSVGKLNGDRVILDRKATSEIAHATVSIQTAAYQGCWNALNPTAPATAIYSLHLRRDGTYRLQAYRVEECWQVWMAALQIYRWKRRHTKGTKWKPTATN